MSRGVLSRFRASGTFLSPGGSVVSPVDVLDRYCLLAICWLDAGVKASSTVMENLLGVVKEVNSGPANSEGRQGCGIVVVGSSRTDPLPVLHCQLTRMPESTFVFTDSEDALEAILIRVAVGLGPVLPVPAVILVDAASGEVLSTDAAQRLRVPTGLSAAMFPQWRTNCFQIAPVSSLQDSSIVFPANGPLLRAGLLSGDIACVRVLASGKVMYGNVNPPEEDEASLEASMSVDDAHNLSDIVMVSTTTYSLLFGDANEDGSEFRTAVVVAEHDVTDAKELTVTYDDDTLNADVVVSEWLDPFFGIGSTTASHAAVLGALRDRDLSSDDEGYDGAVDVSDWMRSYLAAGRCKFRPAWAGQEFVAVHPATSKAVKFRVASPRGPVRVGPSTRVSAEYKGKDAPV